MLAYDNSIQRTNNAPLARRRYKLCATPIKPRISNSTLDFPTASEPKEKPQHRAQTQQIVPPHAAPRHHNCSHSFTGHQPASWPHQQPTRYPPSPPHSHLYTLSTQQPAPAGSPPPLHEKQAPPRPPPHPPPPRSHPLGPATLRPVRGPLHTYPPSHRTACPFLTPGSVSVATDQRVKWRSRARRCNRLRSSRQWRRTGGIRCSEGRPCWGLRWCRRRRGRRRGGWWRGRGPWCRRRERRGGAGGTRI